MAQSDILARVGSMLDDAAASGKPDEVTLRHALNEAWFSDALAWLLDPRGGHGLGASFLREFLKEVAKERCRPGAGYARRTTHLRWSTTPGHGQSVSKLRIGNAVSFREFYLAGSAGLSACGDRYSDVVVLDLDSTDGLVLVIENKLFGTNTTGQLRDQLLAVEDKYRRARIREYVYLTLTGCAPSSTVADETPILSRWVALGWLDCVLPIIGRLEPNPSGRLSELVGLLQWMKHLVDLAQEESTAVTQFIEAILDGTAGCVLDELNRLCKSGHWVRSTSGTHQLRLSHTSAPKRFLSLALLTNCSVAIQSKLKKKARCDKLLLPFGAPARQTFNLMHITARDLYWIHFDIPMAFLTTTKRRTHLNPTEKAFAPLLDFIAKRRFELQALLGVSRRAGQATDAIESQPGQVTGPVAEVRL
jgi:hypothetical protein